MKIQLDGVMETLLITLYVRSEDAKSANPVLNDQKAVEIVEKIDYDFSKFGKPVMSYYGILARAKTIDEEVRKYLAKYPDAVVVSLGAGLDTRFYRVDNGRITWYNLDFPEVIETRKKFFPEHERVKYIGKSVLDPSWTADLELGNRKLLLVSEGMVMYLPEADVKKFLGILVDGLDSFELMLDMISKFVVNHAKQHDTVGKTKAEFLWGVKDGSEAVALEPRLKQTGYINFTNAMVKLLPFKYKILKPFLHLTNNRLGIYSYDKRQAK